MTIVSRPMDAQCAEDISIRGVKEVGEASYACAGHNGVALNRNAGTKQIAG